MPCHIRVILSVFGERGRNVLGVFHHVLRNMEIQIASRNDEFAWYTVPNGCPWLGGSAVIFEIGRRLALAASLVFRFSAPSFGHKVDQGSNQLGQRSRESNDGSRRIRQRDNRSQHREHDLHHGHHLPPNASSALPTRGPSGMVHGSEAGRDFFESFDVQI